MKDFWVKGLFSLGLTLLVCGLILTPSGKLWADSGYTTMTPSLCNITCDGTPPPTCSLGTCSTIGTCRVFACWWVGTPP